MYSLLFYRQMDFRFAELSLLSQKLIFRRNFKNSLSDFHHERIGDFIITNQSFSQKKNTGWTSRLQVISKCASEQRYNGGYSNLFTVGLDNVSRIRFIDFADFHSKFAERFSRHMTTTFGDLKSPSFFNKTITVVLKKS